MNDVTTIHVDVDLNLLEAKSEHGGGAGLTAGERNARHVLSLQSLSASAARVMNSFQNDKLSSVSQGLSTAAKYVGLTKNIAGGNPAGLITLVTTVTSEIISHVLTGLKEEAANKNAADRARIEAGLMDISDTVIITDSLTGRKSYKEGR